MPVIIDMAVPDVDGITGTRPARDEMTKRYDDMSIRMKEYEFRETERNFLPYIPIYARLDGRNFSSLTKGMARPFDKDFSQIMHDTAMVMVQKTNARIVYVQSDEISLVWMTDEPGEELFFGGKVQKLCSILASMATSAFIVSMLKSPHTSRVDRMPHFDARVLQLPNKTEAANAFLWREKDATKNAISMAAQAHFSHRALMGKSGRDKIEMLAQKGISFDDYDDVFRRGSFIRGENVFIPMDEATRMKIPETKRPEVAQMIQRRQYKRIDMPSFTTVTNREAVIFDGADPIVAKNAGDPFLGQRTAANAVITPTKRFYVT